MLFVKTKNTLSILSILGYNPCDKEYNLFLEAKKTTTWSETDFLSFHIRFSCVSVFHNFPCEFGVRVWNKWDKFDWNLFRKAYFAFFISKLVNRKTSCDFFQRFPLLRESISTTEKLCRWTTSQYIPCDMMFVLTAREMSEFSNRMAFYA